jgi:hypothetical protein
MPSRFLPFCTTPYQLSGVRLLLGVDLAQFRTLSALCDRLHPGFPPLPSDWKKLTRGQQLARVAACFQGWIDSASTDSSVANSLSLVNQMSVELVQNFQQDALTPEISRLWRNYYTNICYQVVYQIWNMRSNYLPHLRTPEYFYSLLASSYALSSKDRMTGQRCNWIECPHWMLRSFNSDNSTYPIGAFNAWSRATITNALYSKIREHEDPYFMLSPLGVVTNSKTSYELIENALKSSDFPDIIKKTVRKKYPNPEQGELRREISQHIINHLSGSIEEQFDRVKILNKQFQICKILVRSLRSYLDNSPLAVNQLLENHFLEIGNFYLQRLAELHRNNLSQLSVQLSPSAIELFLKSIGMMVHQYANQINDPKSINRIIGGSDGDMTGEDILADDTSPSPLDFVYDRFLSERFPRLYQEIGRFCKLSPQDNDTLSHQQVLWLYYGLDLNQIEISSFLNIHFGLSHPNPGGVALRLRQARTSLIVSIRERMNISEPLDTNAIELIKDVLEECFSDVRYQLLGKIADRLGIEPPTELAPADRHTFIALVTIEFERNIQRDLNDDVSTGGIERMVANFLNPVT